MELVWVHLLLYLIQLPNYINILLRIPLKASVPLVSTALQESVQIRQQLQQHQHQRHQLQHQQLLHQQLLHQLPQQQQLLQHLLLVQVSINRHDKTFKIFQKKYSKRFLNSQNVFLTNKFSGGCQQPTNAKCYSISAPVGPVGSGCCSGAQCQPWLEPGETYTKPVDWYCQYIEPIVLNGACVSKY